MRVYASDVAANTALVTTAETVIATLSGVTSDRIGQQVRLEGNFQVTLGASTTGLFIAVREDSLTGNVVDESQVVQIDTAATSTEDHTFTVFHTPTGELSGKTYVLTVAQQAATGNGSVVHASLTGTVLP